MELINPPLPARASYRAPSARQTRPPSRSPSSSLRSGPAEAAKKAMVVVVVVVVVMTVETEVASQRYDASYQMQGGKMAMVASSRWRSRPPSDVLGRRALPLSGVSNLGARHHEHGARKTSTMHKGHLEESGSTVPSGRLLPSSMPAYYPRHAEPSCPSRRRGALSSRSHQHELPHFIAFPFAEVLGQAQAKVTLR